jgi:ectoine hydroxylase-related dioxygenase (phytanoyl-CoA dioxygenase family)
MDTHSTVMNTDDYVTEMTKNGVVVFRKLITETKIPLLIKEIGKIREIVMTKLSTMPRPIETYSDISERHSGRLDYRCGFSADIFQAVAAPIIRLIQQLSPHIDFRHYWGVIPSEGGADATNLHRDVYPILNTTTGVNLDTPDIQLPPYYFTVLIPLVEITHENGPTEFVKGSQHIKVVDEQHAEIYAPLTSPGDVIIFDGRTSHRGAANKSNHERLIAYITFVATWYHDQTFPLNNYLFPELSEKEYHPRSYYV